jgi:hypothetical protein
MAPVAGRSNAECKEQIERLFKQEFGLLSERFDMHVLDGDDAISTPRSVPPRPGVYVWIANGRACKVGKHQSNSLGRARDHVRAKDGTGPKLKKAFEGDPRPMLFLLHIRNSQDSHWVPALEAFLERRVDPVVRAGRCE